ncbi:unnamed protein product [Clonostachys chloroleuca]|uniref:Nephrocystin 3-like N-terminal domain-containing protein n=1 Tax=Clonostachys chloroleuca TaxID=1926264 RepID=A0AA35LXI9_9HYPO|nr:unnamed protein product [Clonostachys chloroleuca]
MDPLSIAGSVAGLVSLADVVFRTAAKYRKEVKGSQKEVGDLLNEVKNMSLLLHNLSLIAYDLESSTVPGQARGPNLKLEHLNDCRNLLRRLESGLTGQKEDFELPSRLDRLQARLKWPFSASEMREMVESLRNQQRFINTSLTADSITQLTACLSLQQDTAGGVKDLQTTTSQILDVQTKIQLDERRDRVLEFFLRANPQSEFEMSKKLRHPLTGLWLTEGEDFHRWYNNPGARIWLNGIPGAGKSVIAGAIITECFLQNQSNPGRAVAYFYCTYRDSRTFSASNILSSVATQLARQDEKAYELLEAYYSELRVGDSLPKNPTTKGLRKILSTMSTLFNRVYIIIDGLDECDNEVEENVQCLLALARDSNMKKQVNIALLSRDEVFIRESLEIEFHVVELEAHTEDIQLYVASELEERIGSGRLRTKDMSLRGHIIAELVNRAKGMFRWVACQLDYMCELPTDGARRKALCQLPPTLPATYERILLKVDAHSEQVRSLVKNSLLLIACGGWGLETRMICEAASTSFNCTRLDADEIVEEQEILRWVGSLVRRSNDEDCFEFAHFTVQEFLEKICPSHPTLSAYSISEDKIDGYLASICLKYLTLDNFIQCDPQLTTENIWNLRQLSKSRPFYEFSAISWPIILHGGSYETDDNINFQLQALFHPRKTSQFCLWAIELVRHLYTRPIGELLEPHDDFFDDEKHATVSVSALLMPDFTPLHMSAALGFPQLTKHLINMGCSPNVTSRFGTPLHCAVGGLAVFSDSANVEDLEKFSYAMDHHTGKARRDTVQLLLNAGCSPIYRFQSDFRSSGVLGLSAIYSPFELDGFEIIIDLLRAGAIVEDDDLEVFSVTYDRFLEWSEAEERRRLHDGLLKDLIQVLGAPTVDDGARFELFSMTVQFVAKMKDTITGEIPQEVSIEEQNAVSVSSIIRNNDVSRLGQYLKGGNLDWLETAIPDDKGEGLKPIHLATLERSLDVLGLILESGCNVNSFMDDGGTAASLCWEDKYGECLKLLLKYGASTTIKKGDGTCLWHDAAIEDSGIIMKILVQSEQRDQGLRTISSEGQTPICAAISASNLGSALVMLPYCNKKECWNSNTSIFRDVTKLGWPIILKKLVEVDVDLDGMDNEGSPLHFLPKYPDQECVSLLSSLFDPNQRSPSNQRLPFEHYISRTLGQGTYANPEIYKILLPQEALIQTTESCCHIWTNICEIVALPGNTSEVGISWGSEVLEYLISTKILEIFETERRSSGVILLCDAFLRALAQPDFEAEPQNGCICIDETFGILSDTYWDYFSAMFMVVIEQTTLSRAIVANPTILTAFKHAIAQNDLPLVRLLLRNGAELHTEVDGLSAFEIACMASLSNDVFSCIIEHSQADHLQKANKARRGCGPLHYCHSQGRLSQHEKSIRMRNLRRLLQNIEDCDIPNSEQGGTPLFYHVVRGSISTAEVLVEAGANPWITCASNGLNSVMAAVDQGFTWGTIEILTQNETYPPQWKHTLKHGETVLHIAAAVGNCDCLEVLLDKGIAGHSHTLDKYDRTPMHHAAARGRTEAVRILAQRGGDVNLKTIEGFTPLHFAAKIGHPSIVKVLLELGAKQFECSDGCTPLVYAYTVGNPDVIEMLTTGANIVQSAGLITKPKALLALTKALRDAVMNDDLIACKRLKNLGCPLHIELEISGQCMTPLMLAMSQGKSPTLINWFIENGPLVSIGNRFPINGHYFCVLDVAIMNPLYVGFLPKLMNAFVAEGGDLLSLPHNILFGAIDYRAHGALNILLEEDFKGLTTMNKSAFTCHPEKLSHEARSAIIRLVNKRETESYQESPLIKAISLGAVNAVELLIQAGADADLVSTYGYTALHHATLKGSVDMVQLILDSGCLVNVQNMWQTKAIDFAFSYGNLAIARLLTQAGAHVTTESIMLFGHRRSLAHLFNSDNFWASRSLDLQDPLHIPITMSSREISNITANIPVLRRHMGDAKLSTVLHFHSSGKHSILCQATMLGLMQAVERLVRFGADINHLCEDHGTVLTVAVRFQRFELFRYLFRHGASIDHSSKQLSNVLSNATSMVHPIILDWVLVTRHTERRRITYEQLDMGENITGRWAGVKTAAIGMKWEWGKRRSQSSFEYACRLHDIKRSLRGRVVSPLEVKL